MKKLFTILLLMLPLAMSAQNIKTINVKQGEDISSLVGEDSMKIDSLVISGFMDNKNYSHLKYYIYNGKLRGIDMGNCSLQDDAIAPYAFSVGQEFVELNYITLPKNLKEIGRNAFWMNRLKRIDFPATLRKLGWESFAGTYLHEINIPEGITEIPGYCFYYCNKAESISLPSTLKKIGDFAFSCNFSISDLQWHEGIEEIGKYSLTFLKVEDLVIPESVKKIGEGAFSSCMNLKHVTLPKDLKSIEAAMFRDCENLSSVDFPDNISNIGSQAFSHTGFKMLVLPDNVRMIGNEAFNYCKNMNTVVLPEQLDSLESLSFDGNITSIVYAKNPTPANCNGNPFEGIKNISSSVLYVPVGAKVRYQNAMYWKDFFDIRETNDFPTSAVEAMKMNDAASVSGGNGQITINASANATRYAVYSTDGRKVTEGVAKNETTVNVPSGLYIIKVGQKTSKVMVK